MITDDFRVSVTGARARGALLVGCATLFWSSSGVISRLTTASATTLLFWRSVFAFAFLLAVITTRPSGLHQLMRLRWAGWGITVCFAISMLTFILALRLTTVAHVLIFQAASPFFAALLAWLLLRERVSGAMLIAVAATMAGIGVMVSTSLLQGRWLGDALSLATCLFFAFVIVLARLDRQVDMLPATCMATFLAGLASAPFAQRPDSLTELALMAGFGVCQMGLALLMFTAGVRLLSAADAGLISVLEAVFAPIWTWLAVGEDPGPRAILGGAIVVTSVALYGWHERARGTDGR